MRSKMSLVNKEIILQIGRSTGWIGIVYLLGLLFALPLRMIMIYSDKNHLQNAGRVHNLFQYDFAIQVTLLVAVPILMAVFLFRFLHVKQMSDLMHSIPLKRGKIFHQYALTGVVFLVAPILITAVAVLITYSALDLTHFFTKHDILYWAGVTILIDLIVYAGSVFVAMMTGISLVHAVLSFVFLFFPVGIMLLLFYNLEVLLYGFPSDYFLSKDLEKMSPITYAASLNGKQLQIVVAIIYIVLTLILYWLALFCYKRRKLESASEAIAFANLRLVFKYGVTFCTMLFGGMYFSKVQVSNAWGWTIFGYIAGAILGYFIAEMVLQKTWRVFKAVKGLAVYSLIMIVIITTVKWLGFYENKIPEQNQIKSVQLANNSSIFLNPKESYDIGFISKPLTSKENIEAVRKLHLQILHDKKINLKEMTYQFDRYGPLDPHETDYFVYELQNGSKVIREYRINKLMYTDFYKPIFESTEYKRSSQQIFKMDEKKIRYISITPNGPVNKILTISDPNDIKTLISLLKADILAESYEDSIYYAQRGSSIEIRMGKDWGINLEFRPSYKKAIQWLREKGWYERAAVSADDLDYVLVGKNNFTGVKDPNLAMQALEKQSGVLKITDHEQMKSALERSGILNTGTYAVLFKYKQGRNSEMFYFDDKHVPDFVKEQLK